MLLFFTRELITKHLSACMYCFLPPCLVHRSVGLSGTKILQLLVCHFQERKRSPPPTPHKACNLHQYLLHIQPAIPPRALQVPCHLSSTSDKAFTDGIKEGRKLISPGNDQEGSCTSLLSQDILPPGNRATVPSTLQTHHTRQDWSG